MLILLLIIVAVVGVAVVTGLVSIHGTSITVNTLSFVKNLNAKVVVP